MKTFKLTQSNSKLIFQDKSILPDDFKNRFMVLVYQFANNEPTTRYLRDVNVVMIDSDLDTTQIQEKIQTGWGVTAKYSPLEHNIQFCLNEWLVLSSVNEHQFVSNLERAVRHELVHYLQYSLKNIRESLVMITRLGLRRLKQTKTPESYLAFGLVLSDNFLLSCSIEGFGVLFHRLGDNTLRYDQAYFDQAYKEAISSIEEHRQTVSVIMSQPVAGLAGLEPFIVQNKDRFQLVCYIAGFHIIYSLLYLRHGSYEKTFENLLKNFFGVYGAMKPKNLIAEYASAMRHNGHKPVMALNGEAFLNLELMNTEWKQYCKKNNIKI